MPGIGWFYLSFADGRRPKGFQWLGAAFVKATTFEKAMWTAWLLRINPGGEVMGYEIERLPPEEYRNRLLTRSDLIEIGTKMGGDTRLLDRHGNEIEPDLPFRLKEKT
jgi:hypothetical protein